MKSQNENGAWPEKIVVSGLGIMVVVTVLLAVVHPVGVAGGAYIYEEKYSFDGNASANWSTTTDNNVNTITLALGAQSPESNGFPTDGEAYSYIEAGDAAGEGYFTHKARGVFDNASDISVAADVGIDSWGSGPNQNIVRIRARDESGNRIQVHLDDYEHEIGITGTIINNAWTSHSQAYPNKGPVELWLKTNSTHAIAYVNGTKVLTADITGTFNDPSKTHYQVKMKNVEYDTRIQVDNVRFDYKYESEPNVSGRVYDENNDNISGAVVLANDSGVWVEKRLTNSSGEYSMELPKGNYTLEAWADNHSYVKKDIEVTGDMTVDFLLVSSDNRLYGNVENETGGAIENANVTVALGDGTVIGSDLSSSTGFYEVTDLENGTFNVTVSHPDYNDIQTSINFTDNVQRDFILSKPGYKIDGWVEDSGGDGLGNATITIENSSGVVETVFPTSQGYYLSTGLDSGTYNITASHPDFKEETKQTTLGPDSTVNFTLAKINKSFYHVSGNITNKTDGSAIDDAIVVAENSSGIVGADQSDPAGNYYIGSLRNGSYTLRVAAAGYEQESVDFTIDGGNKTIDVALVGNTSASSNEVYGTVSNRSGPVEGATVEIGLGGYVLGVDQTDANGEYSIPGIGDGKYKMEASKQGHWPSEKQVQVSGDTKVDFEIYIPKIRIEVAHHYMKHGTKQGYTVYIDTGHKRIPITNDSDLTVFSENTTIATVNEANNTILATNNTSVNARVDIVAEYAGINDTGRTYVAVANNTVAQLPVLPPARRVSATVGDTTMFGLILMIWAAIVGSRWTNAFGGLGFGTIGGITLWYAGYLSTGFMLLTVFSALFLGMNIATNIEYSVQR